MAYILEPLLPGSCLFLKHSKPVPATGPLSQLFPLSGTHFPLLLTWWAPSSHSSLGSRITPQGWASTSLQLDPWLRWSYFRVLELPVIGSGTLNQPLGLGFLPCNTGLPGKDPGEMNWNSSRCLWHSLVPNGCPKEGRFKRWLQTNWDPRPERVDL